MKKKNKNKNKNKTKQKKPCINDLPLSLPSSHFIIFADDTNILFSHEDPVQLEN